MDWSVLEFWVGYERELTSLLVYAVGLGLYALLVWLMCNYASRRTLLSGAGKSRTWLQKTGRTFAWLFLFPAVTTVFFLTISIALFFLAKNQSVSQILLVSVSLLAGIRICAWANEDAARDVAKIVPLGLLGVLVVEPGYLSLDVTVARFREVPTLMPLLGRYLLTIFLMELAAKPIVALWAAHDRRKAEKEATVRVPVAAPEPAPTPTPTPTVELTPVPAPETKTGG